MPLSPNGMISVAIMEDNADIPPPPIPAKALATANCVTDWEREQHKHPNANQNCANIRTVRRPNTSLILPTNGWKIVFVRR